MVYGPWTMDKKNLWAHLGSNQAPTDYESVALTEWAIGPANCLARRKNKLFVKLYKAFLRMIFWNRFFIFWNTHY